MRGAVATALSLALLAGSAAAFLNTERLKLERSPVSAPAVEPKLFAPTCACPSARATLAFRLRRPGPVDLAVIDRRDRPVRSLATGRDLPRGPARFLWDGRTDTGGLAPNGRYRFRIGLPGEGRTVVPPEATRLDARAPRLRVERLALAGGGARVAVSYRVDESASAMLLEGGRAFARTPPRPPGAGRVEGVRDPRRTRERLGLTLRARDRAGNLSPAIRLPSPG